MDLWIETLLKSKEGLHSLHPSAIEWADKEGVLYAFNTAGDLLAVRNKQIFFTKDGDLSSETYWDGRKKSFLSEQSEKRAALTSSQTVLPLKNTKTDHICLKGNSPCLGILYQKQSTVRRMFFLFYPNQKQTLFLEHSLFFKSHFLW